MNKEIIFVTHNQGKIKSAQKHLKNINIKIYKYELEEPRSDDIKEIAKQKVTQAYNIVKQPCIALDADFRINILNGFPKTFINFTLETIGIEGILKLMEGKKDRNCSFNECLAYHDGKEIHYFYGKNEGTISRKIKGKNTNGKWSDLWYIFIPKGLDKTLAEMKTKEREERKLIDGSNQALEEFAKWYQSNNNKCK